MPSSHRPLARSYQTGARARHSSVRPFHKDRSVFNPRNESFSIQRVLCDVPTGIALVTVNPCGSGAEQG